MCSITSHRSGPRAGWRSDCCWRHTFAGFFFCTSGRRHTRYWRDWSSDVCSSDLDFIFSNGLSVTPGAGLTVFDRGAADDHDGFKIVAITGVGTDGRTPSNFGAPVSVQDGEIGRASSRERVKISEVAVPLKKRKPL